MSGIGHNSGAFGEDPCEAIERVLDDDTKKLFHYVQWHLADYITGTQGMSPEQEGIYIRFLVRLYDRGKPFPDDDKFMASLMSLDVRRWRRVKSDLVTYGKISVRAGALTNSRFEKERQKRAAELRRQAEATQKYWERKRAEKETSDESRAEVEAKSVESPKEVRANFDEKPNKINETPQHPTLQTRDQRLETKEERKKENTPPPHVPEAAGASGGGDIPELNGVTHAFVEKLARWINPMMPDRMTARASLQNLVRIYPPDIIRDSFAHVEAKTLSGELIPAPIKYLTGTCRGMHAESIKPQKPKKPAGRPRAWD